MNTTPETEDLARIALGRKGQRNTRIRRALIARLLNEDGEGEDQVDADVGDDSDDGAGDDEERQLVKALVGGKLLKRRRLRRLLKAKLVMERGEGEDSDESDEESGEDDGEFARLLVGSRLLRRRRVRRALLAHLIRESAGGDEESEESDEESDEDGGDREGRFVRLVIGSRVLRRRRVRRAVLAHLLKARAEAGEESDEDDETVEDGPDLEREVARLLVGGRAIKRRRMRRALARSLRNGGDD